MKQLALILFFIYTSLLSWQLEVSSLFDNDMVIQHSKPVQIWGKAESLSSIDIHFMDKTYSIQSNEDGHWFISINSCDVGGPYTMIVEAGNEKIEFTNVMIGDVWICSGQSNMNMPLAGWGRVFNYEQEISGANYPYIRLLTIPLTLAASPQSDVKTDGWSVCSPETIADFSATAYFFAREVYLKTGIPIGLIHSSKGGTPIETWMCEESLSDRKDLNEKINEVKNGSDDKYRTAQKKYKNQFKEWYESIIDIDPGITSNPEWFSNSTDISDWQTMNLPSVWETNIGKYDGVIWFAKDVELPESMLGQNLQLNMGPIQDYDITYFNGKKIGNQNSKTALSIYQIPKELIVAGKNRIVVRVLDLYGPGGLWGIHDKFELKSQDGNSIQLNGEWKYKPAIDLSQPEYAPPERINPDRNPTILFNGMIAPLKNVNAAGVIWYQGESNGKNAYQYREMFPRMINHWREHFSNPDLHFYFVQLANYMEPEPEPVDVEWPVIRESQAEAIKLSNTGMASAIDIGDRYDVHPKDKQEVGRRLAQNALYGYYGLAIPYSGPVYESMEVAGDTAIISFKNIYDGFVIKGDERLKEFTIAGIDRVFYNASAKITNGKIVVFSNQVKEPAAVRYAWQNNPEVNLYNSEGLPANPFRTDKWKVKTQ